MWLRKWQVAMWPNASFFLLSSNGSDDRRHDARESASYDESRPIANKPRLVEMRPKFETRCRHS
jgi:hypothetical protein